MTTTYNITVNVPQQKNVPPISQQELSEKIQAYINSLYVHVSVPQIEGHAKYSERIQRLRSMSRKISILSEDMIEDDRLAYLLSK